MLLPDPPVLAPALTLDARFAAAARRCPDAPALSGVGPAFTYSELDRRSDDVAAAIVSRLADSRTPVAVLARHGTQAVAALLGVIKSGCPAVPLDASFPAATLPDYFAAAGVSLVLADDEGLTLLDELPAWRDRILHLEKVAAAGHQVPTASQDRPAFLYFSSGTTGRPRPIAIPHAAALFGIDAYAEALSLGPGDRVAWLTSLAFGASTSIVFGALVSGACLVARDAKRNPPESTPAWIRSERITVLHAVPSLFRRFSKAAAPDDLVSLRAVKLGGEPVLASDFALFKAVCPRGCVLVNGLGITEAGCNVSFFHATHDTAIRTTTVPIGKPIAGVEIRVVGADGLDAEAGEPGDIVVRGSRLACGETELRPGDRGRFLPDGNLLHLGRVGDEVKVRGQRVNLAGIESALREIPGVEDALAGVVDGPTGAEVVACCRSALAADDIRRQLAAKWPSHLVPGRIAITSGDMPRLPGGKPDRAGLLPLFAPSPASAHVPPRDAIEKQIAVIWQRALARDSIGVREDFFDLGGNSLAAASIAGGLERAFGAWIPLNTLVERPTIEKLAEFLRSKSPGIPARRAVLLQDGPLAAPLFCVPGAGSDVFALAQLARWFASDRPFYALQYPGLDGDPQRLRTVEEISGLLLSDLRAIQPDGPILLAGSSFGGLVAVELARHLVAEGRAVAFVGLLDSFGFDYPRLRRHLPLRHHALDLLRRVFPLGRKDELSWSNLRAGFREHLVRIHARRAMRRPGGVVPGAEEKFIYLQEMCFCARDRYAFPPSHIRLHLFRAETGVPDFLYAPDPAMGWSGVAAGGLSIVPVPGSHGFHILDPNAEILAQSMCVAIREALERSPGDAVPVAATRAAWDALAGWWDQQVGDDGNPHTSERLAPVTERLLALRAGERVIDAGCGNGWFSRRLARQGARVLAFDFSEEFIRRARVRNEGAGNPEYLVLDATSEDELRALAPDSFDSAVSTMALHDMATIDPLMAALARAVRPGGRFVFSVPHGPVGASGAGEPTLALAGQPHPHYSFHRPLEDILALGTKRGWRCDGNETVMLGEGEAAVWIVRLTRT